MGKGIRDTIKMKYAPFKMLSLLFFLLYLYRNFIISFSNAVKVIRQRSPFTHLELIQQFNLVQDVINFFGLLSSFIVLMLTISYSQRRLEKCLIEQDFSPLHSPDETSFAFHMPPFLPSSLPAVMETCQLQTKSVSFPIQSPSGSSKKTTAISQLTIFMWNISEHLPEQEGPTQKPPDLSQTDATHSLPLQAIAEGRHWTVSGQSFHWSAVASNSIHDFLIAKHSLPQQKYLFNGNQIWVINLKPIKLYVS